MNQSDRDKRAVEGIRMEYALKQWQNTSKSTRDYIKNWGRTAARSRQPKTFECYEGGLHIGKVTVKWSTDLNDFVWLACLNVDYISHSHCRSETEATDAVQTMYYTLMSKMTLGQWLKMMCRRNRITTAGFAERLGLTRQTVHYWVTDVRQCGDLNVYHQIAALFADFEGCTLNQMLGHMSLLFERKK